MDTIKDRKRLVVSIFSDEYEKIDLNNDMTLFEAQSHIRNSLDLPPRQRASTKGTIRKLLGTASEERLKDVLEKLQEPS